MTTLKNFCLPNSIHNTSSDIALGVEIIQSCRKEGIFQVELSAEQDQKTKQAFIAGKEFFNLSPAQKSAYVSDLSYTGYLASGKEIVDGKADYSETFTVCKDIPKNDLRVQQRWPGHGPAIWPNDNYQQSMTAFMTELGIIGEKVLKLMALGLKALGKLEDVEALTSLTQDGWHHMRVLRCPATSSLNQGRGIGSHTDYGLMVISAQDDVGGLYIRPPIEGEIRRKNWLPNESTSGMYEHDEPWILVKPVPRAVTIFPGDLLQFITDGYLLSTPHKVKLNAQERLSFIYFHEPSFEACIRPLSGHQSGENIHYGAHFTNSFTRLYPKSIATHRILAEDRLALWLTSHLEKQVTVA